MQAAVIPEVLRYAHGPLLSAVNGWQPRDICVSAPTGSGKTLAYVLPIIQVSDLSELILKNVHHETFLFRMYC